MNCGETLKVYIVEQHPVMLVVTERSFRIVDVGACDTVQKFHIQQVTFSGTLNQPGEPEVFTAILHGARLLHHGLCLQP
jgi:hypothetical protein